MYATKAMGALKIFRENSHVDTCSKYIIFRAFPTKLLLWGCKAWSLCATLKNNLEVFLQCHLRRILKISMSQVKEDHIHRADIREMFYNIPSVENTIAAMQLIFIGKVIRYPSSDWPSKMMPTESCNHSRPEQGGHPQYHNKDTLVSNLCLFFERLHELYIDPWYGTLKDWIYEASDERYWNQLIQCLLHPSKKLPARTETWNRRRQSSRNRNWMNTAPSPTPPPRRRNKPYPPSPPPCNRVPPPQQKSTNNNTDQEYNVKNIGRVMYDSLKVFGLGFGASETEVEVQFRAIYRIYHPDKHKTEQNGMEDATTSFQILNNAHSYLREDKGLGVCQVYQFFCCCLKSVFPSSTVTTSIVIYNLAL